MLFGRGWTPHQKKKMFQYLSKFFFLQMQSFFLMQLYSVQFDKKQEYISLTQIPSLDLFFIDRFTD